jgi:hypothetical protein
MNTKYIACGWKYPQIKADCLHFNLIVTVYSLITAEHCTFLYIFLPQMYQFDIRLCWKMKPKSYMNAAVNTTLSFSISRSASIGQSGVALLCHHFGILV